MIIAFANFSGNSGKTTVSSTLAAMTKRSLLRIESTNSTFSPADIEIAQKSDFGDAIGVINGFKLREKSLIVDIGSSDLGHLFAEIDTEYKSLKGLIDFWVIPCVNEMKQIADTKKTINALLKAEIPPQKIIVIFNKITIQENKNLLQSLTEEAKNIGYFVAKNYIGKFSIFNILNTGNTSITAILSANLDLDKDLDAALNSKNWKEVSRLGGMKEMQNMARTVTENVYEVFKGTPIFSSLEGS